MINLVYRIAGDVNPLKKALTVEAPAAAKQGGVLSGEAFGQSFGGQLKSVIMQYIGITAIAGAVKDALAEAQRIVAEAQKGGVTPENQQVLEIAAKRTGLSVDEFKAALKVAPKEGEALLADASKTPGIRSDVGIKASADVATGLKTGTGVFARIWDFVADGLITLSDRLVAGGARLLARFTEMQGNLGPQGRQNVRLLDAYADVVAGELEERYQGGMMPVAVPESQRTDSGTRFLGAVKRNKAAAAMEGIQNTYALQNLGNVAGGLARNQSIDWVVGGIFSELKRTMDKNSDKLEDIRKELEKDL